jgi:heptose-I-phosphate ethanolaminephosphotransferase
MIALLQGWQKLIKKISALFLKPISANLRFFVIITLLGMVTPVAFIVITKARLLTIFLWTFLQSICEAYLLCLLMQLLRSRKLKRTAEIVLCAIWGLLAVAEIGSIAMTGEPITEDTVALMLETTVQESTGFFEQYFSLKTGMILLCFGAVIVAIAVALPKLRPLMCRWRVARTACIAFFMVTICGGFVRLAQQSDLAFIRNEEELLRWVSQGSENPDLMRIIQLRYADPVMKWTYLYKVNAMQIANTSAWEQTQLVALKSPCKGAADRNFDIILVIGESMIRSHSSLYGYYLPTNPRLLAERDSNRLVVFQDMYTTANYTTPSIRNMLNLNDLSAGELWTNSVYFPLLVKRGGWNVYHYDNQTVEKTTDGGIAGIFYSDVNMQHVYDGVSDSIFEYDGSYVDYVQRTLMLREKAGKRFVIYHLMGQHFPASSRYPGNGRFSASDITINREWLTDDHRAAVAQYDSAMAYNDSIVGAIIDQRNKVPTILIYLSDHGEDCWDLAPLEARNKQMPEDRAWMDRQFHIPFMVWMSDSFQEEYPGIAQRIRNASTQKGMLDNLGQFVLGVSGIKTEYYSPMRDIASPQYKAQPRVTSAGYEID